DRAVEAPREVGAGAHGQRVRDVLQDLQRAAVLGVVAPQEPRGEEEAEPGGRGQGSGYGPRARAAPEEGEGAEGERAGGPAGQRRDPFLAAVEVRFASLGPSFHVACAVK